MRLSRATGSSGEAATLFNGLPAWLLSDGRIGHEIPARGVLEALGFAVERRPVRPRPLFAALAPFGPADPRDLVSLLASRSASIVPPVVFAAGRRTVPVLRALKRARPGTFTAFFGDPRTARHGSDAIWAPAHDGLSGPTVVTTVLTPHTRSPATLAAARKNPDGRVVALPGPRAALLLGGPSRHHRFGARDCAAVVGAAAAIRAMGFSLGVSASRRTPAALVETLRARFAADSAVFIYANDGTAGFAGENPYSSLLALADAIVVTADSTNMIAEALAVGVPVHILPLDGDGGRPGKLVEHLVAEGAVRRWTGALEAGRTVPQDATPVVAAALAARIRAFQQAHPA